jgi:hypothetical protein
MRATAYITGVALFFAVSCSSVYDATQAKQISPRCKVVRNYDWSCEGGKQTAHSFYFSTGFNQDTVRIFEGGTMVYEEVLSTRPSTGTAGAASVPITSSTAPLAISFNGGLQNPITLDAKRCFLYVKKQGKRFIVAHSSKYPKLRQ